MSPEFADAQTPALRLHYARWASPGRPPLLLAHATGFCGMVWSPVAELLADSSTGGDGGHEAIRYDVYAADRRGHGRSDKPAPRDEGGPSGYELEVYADDLVALLDTLGLRQVYAAGHSGGATEILIAAARRPDLFRRIVAIEPIIAPPESGAPNSTNVMAEQARRRRSRFGSRAEVAERYGSRPPFDSWQPAALRAYVEYGFLDTDDGEVELACPPAIEAAQFGSAGTFDPAAVLTAVSCPVLILNGEASGPQFATMAETALASLPAARREFVPGTTHFVPMEAPEAVAAHIRAFAEE